MKRNLLLFGGVIFLVFYLSCSENSNFTETEKTGTIKGKVTDSNSGYAVESTNITTSPATNAVTTDSSGEYEITGVNPGLYSVSASKTGYNTNSVNISVKEGKTTTADISISISNDSPTASFTVDPLSGNTSTNFNFDASGCLDKEDPTSALEVRWDWENDGTWDTDYSTTKTDTHQYSTEGTKIVKLEVKDTGDLTHSTTSQISVSDSIVTDIDGNTYKIIKIGNQWWMTENLKVTHYSNGEAIPNVTDNTEWTNLSTGAYCNYDNNSSNVATYGRLYNWYAVNNSRNIAPAGWHVPTDEEWKELEKYLGMSQSDADNTGWRGTDEGGKMKEEGTTHWQSPNTGATNSSGFSALPGGYRRDGNYYYMGYGADFWSSTEHDSGYAWYRLLSYDSSDVGRNGNYKQGGFSVRCIRD